VAEGIEGAEGQLPLPPSHKFWAVGKFWENLSVGKLSYRNAKFVAELPPLHFGEIRVKIEILTTNNLLSEMCSCLSENYNFLFRLLF